MSKLMMLVAAKWRQFTDLNPGLGGGSSGAPGGGSEENTNTSVSSEYTKTPRSRREKDKVCYIPFIDDSKQFDNAFRR